MPTRDPRVDAYIEGAAEGGSPPTGRAGPVPGGFRWAWLVLAFLSAWLPAGCDSAGSSPVEPASPTVAVSPLEAWLLTGDTLRLHVMVRGGDGAVVPDPEVSFSSSDPSKAAVSADGLVRALEPGSPTISARAGDAVGTARLQIHPGGGLRVPALAVVDRLVLDFIERWNIPGAAVGITYDERLVLLRGYGLADRESAAPMDPDALFRLASLSKPLAATAILRLVEEGRLALDEPAFEILSGLEPLPGASPDPRLGDVTVRHLLQHRGGWDRSESGDWTWPPYVQEAAEALGVEGPPTAEELLRWIMGRPLDFDPGTRYAYSNIGYLALARVVEHVTGEGYETFVREQVLAPAGAVSMRLGGSLPEDRLSGEVRYHDSGSTESVFPGLGTVPWAYGGFAMEARDGSGAWVSSAADYLRFLHAVDGREGRPDVIEEATVEWINTKPEGPAFADATTWYNGFHVRPEGGGHFWHHRGGLPGTRTLVIHRPDLVSYVILLNSQGSSPSEVSSEMGTMLGAPLREVGSWPTHDLFDQHP